MPVTTSRYQINCVYIALRVKSYLRVSDLDGLAEPVDQQYDQRFSGLGILWSSALGRRRRLTG